MRQRTGKRKWWAGLVVISLLLSGCGTTVTPTPTSQPTPNVAQEASKVDTTLRDLLVAYQSGGLAAARDYARNLGLLDDQDRVRFGITLTSTQAAPVVTSQIQKMGGQVYTSQDDQLGVLIDLNRLTTYFNTSDKHNFFQELASLKEIRELKILLRPALAADPVGTNEGSGVIGADRWQAVGLQGKDIQVGIIDGGFAGYGGYLGTALPPTGQVEFKSFLLGNGAGSETHGVAVAEIVHSLAPAARLILAPIEDEIGFTRAVQYFIDRKVQIIQISLGWAGLFPGDGTGRMDEKLDEARRAGILPIVSTGNYGLSHYMATFQPDERGFHRFDNGQTILKLKAESESVWLSLHWEEKWDAPQTNLDLYVSDSTGRPLISSRNEQGPGSAKPPTELAPFRAVAGQTYSVQVKLTGPLHTPAPRFHLFAYNATLEEATAESSLATPGDARGVLSVGATAWKDDAVELYSSRGPTLDGRAKPDIMAPSGVSSRVFKGTFAGTSASAPQVAGAAALVWGAAREMTADQVAVYLARQALDIGPLGRDALTGFGRLRLGSAAVAQAGLIELLGAQPVGPAFQDDFRDASTGLPDNKLAHYSPTEGYVVQAMPGQLSWQSYLGRSFEEFRASVGVQPADSGGGLFYGLVFWQQAADDYYAWLINDNRYALVRRTGPIWTNLIDWSQDAALQPDNSGGLIIGLEATGAYIRLRANGNILQSIFLRPQTRTPPPSRLGGKFGFLVGDFEADPAYPVGVVTFQKLVITPLSIK